MQISCLRSSLKGAPQAPHWFLFPPENMFINAIDVNERPKISSYVQGCDDFNQDSRKHFETWSNTSITAMQIFGERRQQAFQCRSTVEPAMWSCDDVFLFLLSAMLICVVLKTKVEFSNRVGDNEPQRRCRAFHAVVSIAEFHFCLRLLFIFYCGC